MEINGKPCVEHRVKISSYVSATLQIPEEMSAGEFRGIMSMSNHLIKISREGSDEMKTEIKHTNNRNIKWTEEMLETLKKEGPSHNINELAEILNLPSTKIRWKAKDLGIKLKTIYTKRNTFSDDKSLKINRDMSDSDRKTIINLYENTKPQDKEALAQKLGCKSKHNLSKLVSMWKITRKLR